MKNRSFMLFALSFLPLALAACGEGYQETRTTEVFPYGNQRTAGSSVAFVRAHMLPEKELNIMPAPESYIETRAEPEPQAAPEPENDDVLRELEDDLEKLFEKNQRK